MIAQDRKGIFQREKIMKNHRFWLYLTHIGKDYPLSKDPGTPGSSSITDAYMFSKVDIIMVFNPKLKQFEDYHNNKKSHT